MARPILHRVLHGTATPTPSQESLFVFRPAVLPHYSRHKVRDCEYPAIIPWHRLSHLVVVPHGGVRGVFVTGLTDEDLKRLDEFEGEEYERCTVTVKVLGENGEVEGEVECGTYVWTKEVDRLEDGDWDFEDFVKVKMVGWKGPGVGNRVVGVGGGALGTGEDMMEGEEIGVEEETGKAEGDMMEGKETGVEEKPAKAEGDVGDEVGPVGSPRFV
jgi:hypothetical protein